MRWLGVLGSLPALWRFGPRFARGFFRVLAANVALAQRTAERDVAKESARIFEEGEKAWRDRVRILTAELAASEADNQTMRDLLRRQAREAGLLDSPDDSAASTSTRTPKPTT